MRNPREIPSDAAIDLYKKLGIKQFRRFYLATMGRLLGIDGKSFVKSDSIDALEETVDMTLKIEGIHSVGCFFMALHSITEFANNGMSVTVPFYIALNIFINLYPIMLQQLTRKQLCTVIDVMSENESAPHEAYMVPGTAQIDLLTQRAEEIYNEIKKAYGQAEGLITSNVYLPSPYFVSATETPL